MLLPGLVDLFSPSLLILTLITHFIFFFQRKLYYPGLERELAIFKDDNYRVEGES